MVGHDETLEVFDPLARRWAKLLGGVWAEPQFYQKVDNVWVW